MAHYFIGDIQGCFAEFELLLAKVAFNPAKDTLWSCGDIVARGPDSLQALNYFYQHQDSCHMVLGNHDLHLIAVYEGIKKANPKDRVDALLQSHDINDKITWLKRQPLFRELPEHKLILCHAGIPPDWDFTLLKKLAHAVEQVLPHPEDGVNLLQHMYGDAPNQWSEDLTPIEAQHYAINALTRMRFLHSNGALDFHCKSDIGSDSEAAGLIPWFMLPSHIMKTHKIIFGHWAALMGITGFKQAIGLDTGCVWGNKLTLWHLEKNEFISQDALASD